MSLPARQGEFKAFVEKTFADSGKPVWAPPKKRFAIKAETEQAFEALEKAIESSNKSAAPPAAK